MVMKNKKSLSSIANIVKGRVNRKRKNGNQRNVPVSYGIKRNLKRFQAVTINDDCVVSGSDWAKQIIMRLSNDKVGAVIWDLNINPFTMSTTRLSKLAALYDFWTIEQMTFTFTGSQPTSTPGIISGYIDYDCTDNLGNTSVAERNLEIAYAHRDTIKSTKVYDKQTWVWSDFSNVRMKKLFCNPTVDPTLSSSGRFYLLCDSRVGVTTDVAVGTLYCTYRIRFHKPQLDDTLYGYAAKWAGGGTMTPAHPFGDTPYLMWSNLPQAKDPVNDLISVYPGNYLIVADAAGTGLTNSTFTYTPAVTSYYYADVQLGAGTYSMAAEQFSCDEVTEIKWVLTGTTVTASNFFILSLPIDAVSLKSDMTKAKNISAQLEKRISELKALTRKTETEFKVDSTGRKVLPESTSPIVVVEPSRELEPVKQVVKPSSGFLRKFT